MSESFKNGQTGFSDIALQLFKKSSKMLAFVSKNSETLCFTYEYPAEYPLNPMSGRAESFKIPLKTSVGVSPSFALNITERVTVMHIVEGINFKSRIWIFLFSGFSSSLRELLRPHERSVLGVRITGFKDLYFLNCRAPLLF